MGKFLVHASTMVNFQECTLYHIFLGKCLVNTAVSQASFKNMLCNEQSSSFFFSLKCFFCHLLPIKLATPSFMCSVLNCYLEWKGEEVSGEMWSATEINILMWYSQSSMIFYLNRLSLWADWLSHSWCCTVTQLQYSLQFSSVLCIHFLMLPFISLSWTFINGKCFVPWPCYLFVMTT